ncbi:MAG: cytotoxic translational repressor of toxin-antitoxin stability system [Verrucomicrobiota bacterium JB024]|nr:cytotoxic translational repressor of toxin-antitoxin stability system [Verrucomicrobiota bacterium JB024]
MYQVNFSEQAMRELNRLGIEVQMPLIEKFTSLTSEELAHPKDELGHFIRDGRTYYRLRAGEFRIYFEQRGDTLYSHYILHQHSLADFIFRFKLPYKEETLVEQHQSFWKYIESLYK